METKPAPAPLLYAADQLYVGPQDCVVIGDSRNDVDAARAAGMADTVGDVGIPPGLGMVRNGRDATGQSIQSDFSRGHTRCSMMNRVDYQRYRAEGYNRIPLAREVLADLDTPVSTYLKLARGTVQLSPRISRGG